jgi:hypothetical protein
MEKLAALQITSGVAVSASVRQPQPCNGNETNSNCHIVTHIGSGVHDIVTVLRTMSSGPRWHQAGIKSAMKSACKFRIDF